MDLPVRMRSLIMVEEIARPGGVKVEMPSAYACSSEGRLSAEPGRDAAKILTRPKSPR